MYVQPWTYVFVTQTDYKRYIKNKKIFGRYLLITSTYVYTIDSNIWWILHTFYDSNNPPIEGTDIPELFTTIRPRFVCVKSRLLGILYNLCNIVLQRKKHRNEISSLTLL